MSTKVIASSSNRTPISDARFAYSNRMGTLMACLLNVVPGIWEAIEMKPYFSVIMLYVHLDNVIDATGTRVIYATRSTSLIIL
jgi:hypothetical protein